MEEAIRNIVQHFDNYITNSTKKINELTSPTNGVYDIYEMERKITKDFPNSKFSARDASCEIFYANFPEYSPGQDALFKSISHSYLEKYNKTRLGEMPYKGNPFSDALMTKDDMGFGIISDAPNRIQYIYNTGIRMFVFVKLLPKEAGRAALLFIILDTLNVMKDYINNIDSRTLVANREQIRLTAFNPIGFKWVIPPPSSGMQFLEQSKAAYILGKPVYRKLNIKGEKYVSICVSNTDRFEVCYLGFLPIDRLEETIFYRKTFLAIGAIMAMVLLFSVIIWLMRQIIAPLGDLEVGIKALENRKFEVQIPVPAGNDELVKLFKEFNFMMGENYDMQLAKNVQEGLVTNKFPESENYFIDGNSIPAGELGGDCLTSFALPDGKILFLIGDLTGHSIGSALMMAFVRSVTFNWSQSSNQDPISLVEAIDQMLRDNKIEKMYMGIVCGVFNPLNGKINFITNGHIYPLFLRNDNTVEWLGKPALPLGIGHKRKFISQETELLPGERLLCLSDGIIEISCNGGMTTGYELIEKWAIEASKNNSKEWINNIISYFKQWCEDKKVVQTDDLTLFGIVFNNSKGENI